MNEKSDTRKPDFQTFGINGWFNRNKESGKVYMSLKIFNIEKTMYLYFTDDKLKGIIKTYLENNNL